VRAAVALCAVLLAACDAADPPESAQPHSSSTGRAGRDAQRALRDTEYRAQIETQTHAIEGGQLSGESLASALHDRAAAHMSLAEWPAALRDLDDVARLRPADPHAWVDRAHVHLSQGDEAAADADLAQARARGALGPRDALVAGLIEYLRGRPKDALDTFRGALADEEGTDGMYARLWIATLASQVGSDADTLLGQGLADELPDRWPAPIVRFMAGELTEEELLRHVGRRVSQDNLERKCETWFYIGQQRRLEGRLKEAGAAYRNALDTGVREYFEHLAAQFELERLPAAPDTN
jgi:lipoprotein NlpI